jgi:plasmid stability protein
MRRSFARNDGENVEAFAYSSCLTPMPCMNRSRICTGSRRVVPVPGLSSMRTPISVGPAACFDCSISRSKSSSSAAQVLLARPLGMAGRRGRLAAGDLVDAVVHHHHGQVVRRQCCDGREAAELHQQRAVAFERDHPALRLRQCDAERDREGEAHAAQHVEILRAMACGPEIEIGVADAADHGFVLQFADEALGQIESVHHLGVALCAGHGRSHLSKVLPPVSSGERISATGAWVVIACLIERSAMNSSSSSLVMV